MWAKQYFTKWFPPPGSKGGNLPSLKREDRCVATVIAQLPSFAGRPYQGLKIGDAQVEGNHTKGVLVKVARLGDKAKSGFQLIQGRVLIPIWSNVYN